jgi:hypothetical protein
MYVNKRINRVGGVMDSVFSSSAVDRRFELWSGQIKDYIKEVFALIKSFLCKKVKICIIFPVFYDPKSVSMSSIVPYPLTFSLVADGF